MLIELAEHPEIHCPTCGGPEEGCDMCNTCGKRMCACQCKAEDPITPLCPDCGEPEVDCGMCETCENHNCECVCYVCDRCSERFTEPLCEHDRCQSCSEERECCNYEPRCSNCDCTYDNCECRSCTDCDTRVDSVCEHDRCEECQALTCLCYNPDAPFLQLPEGM